MSNFTDNIHDYEINSLLGQGSFGKVYTCQYLNDSNNYAIKIIEKSRLKSKSAIDRIYQECNIHSKLKHKHIIDLKHCFEDHDHDHIYLIMEMATKTLDRYIKEQPYKRCKESRTRIWTYEILDALLYLHHRNIIHRDITTSNILIDDSFSIKICDFGLATEGKNGSSNNRLATSVAPAKNNNFTMCGTPNFIAPEVVNRCGHGPEADVFSLGCVFYTMLVGKPPFDTATTKETLERVTSYDYTIPDYISEDAEKLIKKLLSHKSKRPGLMQVKTDPFFVVLHPLSKTQSSLGTYDSGFSDHQRSNRRSRSSTGEYRESQNHYASNPVLNSETSHRHYNENNAQNLRGISSERDLYTLSNKLRSKSLNRPSTTNTLRNSNFSEKLDNIIEENTRSPSPRVRKLETLDDSVLNTSTTNHEPYKLGHVSTSAHNTPIALRKTTSSLRIARSSTKSHDLRDRSRQLPPANNFIHKRQESDPARMSPIFNRKPPMVHKSGLPSFSSSTHRSRNLKQNMNHVISPVSSINAAGDNNNNNNAQNTPVFKRTLSTASSIPTALNFQGVSSSFHKEPTDELTRPLSCKRLRPEQNKGGASRSTVLPNHKGCVLEILNKQGKVSQVIYVSHDGMSVIIGVTKIKEPLAFYKEPVGIEQLKNIEKYAFDSLPQKFYKKYKHLRNLCDLIRSRTPKVTNYSTDAKCVLYESANSSHAAGQFEATFYKPKIKIELTYENKNQSNLKMLHSNVCNFKYGPIRDLNDLDENAIRKLVADEVGNENENILLNSYSDSASNITSSKDFNSKNNNSNKNSNKPPLYIFYINCIKHAWNARSWCIKTEQNLSEMEAKLSNENPQQNSINLNNQNNHLKNSNSIISDNSELNNFSFFPVIFSHRPTNIGPDSVDHTPASTAPNSARGLNSNSGSNHSKGGSNHNQQHKDTMRKIFENAADQNLMSTNANLQTLNSIHDSDIGTYKISPTLKKNNNSLQITRQPAKLKLRQKSTPYGFIKEHRGQFECYFTDDTSLVYLNNDNIKYNDNISEQTFSLKNKPHFLNQKLDQFREMVTILHDSSK